MGLFANGDRRGPVSVRAARGTASSEWVHPGRQALPNRYLANHLVMTDAAFGAQLKRNVEETVLAGQWAT